MVWAQWRKPAIGAGVLALHALLALVLIRMQFAPPPRSAEREITLLLLPVPKPRTEAEKKTPPAASTTAQPAIAFPIPRQFTAPTTITLPDSHALDGVGASLGCGTTLYVELSPEARAACAHAPWIDNKEQRETLSLIVKAPHVMSAADRAERIRSTVDPCAAEKLTHQVDCIYHIIYGDKLP